jgi:cytochrome c peroxidase
MTALPVALALAVLLSAPAAAMDPDPVTPEQALARVFNNAPMAPAYRQASTDEVELGRALFFDPRLSSNGMISCSKCHNPGMGWRDGLPRARGLNQQVLKRRAPSLLNAGRTELFFWDGRAGSFGEAALTAIANPEEMNTPVPDAVRALSAIPGYGDRFAKTYGTREVSPERIAAALEAFVLSATRLPPSPFDRYAAGDKDALSDEAKLGLIVFAGKGRCQRCHMGANFSDGFFHNTGVKPSADGDDSGRYAVTPFKRAFRAFKTVPLRNSALTAPYMHNGALKNLTEVVEFYNRGGDETEELDMEMKPLKLTSEEKAGLVAFLESLTNPPVSVATPILPGPAAAAAEPLPPLPADALARAEARAAEADAALRAAVAGTEARSCRQTFTIDKAVAAYNAGKVPSGVVGDSDHGQGELEDILFERIYRVALTGDMKLCDPLKMPVVYAGISQPGSFWCRDLYLDAAAALMLVKRSPAFDGVCQAWAVTSYPKLPAAEAAQACAVIRANISDPEKLCSALVPRWLDPAAKPGCVSEYRRYTQFDDPQVCDYVKGATDSLHLRCDDYARLARAEHAHDPSLCGDSEICRLLTGTGKELPAKYEERARTAWCEALSKDAVESDLAVEGRAARLLQGAEDDLAQVEAVRARDDRAVAARIDAVSERVARARRRLTAPSAQASAAAAPPARY